MDDIKRSAAADHYYSQCVYIYIVYKQMGSAAQRLLFRSK